MIGRKFRAKEKLAILERWQNLGGGYKNAKRIARYSNCSLQSIYVWHSRFNGTADSLENGNQTPHRLWNAFTSKELNEVKEIYKQYGNIGRMELYGRFQVERGFTGSVRTMYRMLKKLTVAPVTELKTCTPQIYNTPKMAGVKWQIDVKYVPTSCLVNIPNSTYYYRDGYRLYQYTCIDEATRKRFMYVYDSFHGINTVDFMKRCIIYFGYKPLIVQTDNGGEFCLYNEKGMRKTHKKGKDGKFRHAFTEFLRRQGIRHDLIKVATPRHNGKVERSHRTDNQEFYCHYEGNDGFMDITHAREQLKGWVYRYNNVRVMSVLNYKTPQVVENTLLEKLRQDNCVVTYIDIERPKGTGNKPYEVERQGTVTFMPRSIEWAFAVRPI
jgi:transposase InsO family protein